MECVLGERASERADRARWSSRLEPIEEVLAEFAHVEFGKQLHGKRDSACVCTWMVEAPSSQARQESAPFCLHVHVPDEAPEHQIDEGQPLAGLSTSLFKERGFYFCLSPFVCVCVCVCEASIIRVVY